MKYRLGILFGGESVEHEISIITANQVLHALNRDKYDVYPLYVGKNRQIYFSELLYDLGNYRDLDQLIAKCQQVSLVKQANKLKALPIKSKLFKNEEIELDILLPIVHGTNSEDGTFQGFIEMLKVPYVGCNVQAAAVGQDKVFMRQILQQSGLPLLPWTWLYSSAFTSGPKQALAKIERELPYPLIVKPASLGSSVGIATAKNRQELIAALTEASSYDRRLVVETLLSDFLEINCSVLGNSRQHQASVVEEVAKSEEILSYADKYEGGGKAKGMVATSRIIPARLSAADTKTVQDLAEATFIALDASGVVRVDFLQENKTKKIYVNEINTMPGSLSFYLWQESGINFSELMDRLIAIALDNFREKSLLTYSHSTNVLKNYRAGSKGGKK